MSAITAVVGLGIFSFVLLALLYSLESKHWPLKILGYFFILSSLLMIPKVLYDESAGGCTGTTNVTNVNANITSYDYVYDCDTPSDQTMLSFTNLTIWFYRIFVAYAFIFLFWIVMLQARDWNRRRKEGGGEYEE